jgi:hypothetical protein
MRLPNGRCSCVLRFGFSFCFGFGFEFGSSFTSASGWRMGDVLDGGGGGTGAGGAAASPRAGSGFASETASALAMHSSRRTLRT